MAEENSRDMATILKEYKETKDKARKGGPDSLKNQEKAIELLKEKNSLNASFEDAEQAYKDAGL